MHTVRTYVRIVHIHTVHTYYSTHTYCTYILIVHTYCTTCMSRHTVYSQQEPIVVLASANPSSLLQLQVYVWSKFSSGDSGGFIKFVKVRVPNSLARRPGIGVTGSVPIWKLHVIGCLLRNPLGAHSTSSVSIFCPNSKQRSHPASNDRNPVTGSKKSGTSLQSVSMIGGAVT